MSAGSGRLRFESLKPEKADIAPDLIEGHVKTMFKYAPEEGDPTLTAERLRDELGSIEGVSTEEIIVADSKAEELGRRNASFWEGASLRREGVIYQVLDGDGNALLVKLFNGGFNPNKPQLDKLLVELFANQGGSSGWMGKFSMITRDNPHDRARSGLKTPYILAAQANSMAEIVVRAAAHILDPDIFPKPLAIKRSDGFIVGFSLPLRAPVASIVDSHLNMTTFYMHGISYPINYNLPTELVDMIRRHHRSNVWVYCEDADDIRNQAMFDERGSFLCFARQGYMTVGYSLNDEAVY